MGAAAVDVASRFVDGRYSAPTSDYTGLDALLTSLAAPPPNTGTALSELLGTIETAAGKGFDTANPGFMAYIPGGGLYASALADFLACVVNRYTAIAQPAPALVAMEAAVLRWLCELFGLPPTSQGVLTPGGSMSNLSAVVAARTRQLGERFADGTMYVSAEAHHSIAKSARIAGIPGTGLRVVPTDDALRMDVDALRAAVVADRAQGRTPFLVVASAGTINTGVVDPLGAIAELAQAGLQVTAGLGRHNVRQEPFQHGFAPGAARAQHEARAVQVEVGPETYYHVVHLLPRHECQQLQIVGNGALHVFGAMHRNVDLARAQGGFQFFREDALGPDLIQGTIQHHVAGGGDDDDFGGQPRLPQAGRHMVSLPQGQLAATSTDANGFQLSSESLDVRT